MSLQKLIEKIRSDAEYPHVFSPSEVLRLCQAAEIMREALVNIQRRDKAMGTIGHSHGYDGEVSTVLSKTDAICAEGVG